MYVAVALALFAVIVVMALKVSFASITVFEYERGLRFSRGTLKGELGPGFYRYLRPYTSIVKVDTRPVTLAVNGQEVLTKDGVAVKASLTATYQVIEPTVAILQSENHVTALYTELQQALRTIVSTTEIEELLKQRSELGTELLKIAQANVSSFGTALQAVAVRDLTLPGDLKRIFAQVVKARQEGLAALERARGETAALRNLANAAQMVERNPHLLQLRLIQVAEQQTNSTFVVGVPQGTTLPIRDGRDVSAITPPESNALQDE